MPPDKNNYRYIGRTDFPKTKEAVANAWEMKGLLEEKGIRGRLEWLMLAQMGHESGFYTPVAMENNNYTGIKWYANDPYISKYPKGRSVPPDERKHTKDGSGDFYVNFPSKDAYLTTLLHYLNKEKIGQGKPINATTFPEYAIRLKYDGYYGADVPTYAADGTKWIPVLQKMGIIPKNADLAYAAGEESYSGVGYNKGIPFDGNDRKPPSFVSPADLGEEDMTMYSLPPSFIQSAANEARRLLPGTNIGKELDSIARRQLRLGIAHLKYLDDLANIQILKTQTEVIPQDPYHDSLLAVYSKTGIHPQDIIKIGEDVLPTSANSSSWYEATLPISDRQAPSGGNTLSRDFQWLLNGFQYPAAVGDIPAVNTYKPALHPSKEKGKTKPHTKGTADAITSGGSPDSYRDKMVSIQFRNFTENFTVHAGSTDKGAQETFRMFEERFLQMLRSVPA